MKRAIEEDFPIVEINRLVVPERNGFKPIYQMHKSFAPRASCVFRSILLGTFKPTGASILKEFYDDHTDDPDTKSKVILDPFMGGGTTIVEAARMGFRAIGIELNPVPWFVVKMALAPASIDDLNDAFTRLKERIVTWSGKSLDETLSQLYQADPPFCQTDGSEVIDLAPSHVFHTYWVKSAVCISSACKKLVPLFTDYVVAKKAPSIRFHPDCTCPSCGKTFDWDIEPAALVADPRLMFHPSTYSAGSGRSMARWTYAHPDGGLFVCQGASTDGQAAVRWGTVPKSHICCPHCNEVVKPKLASDKPKRKKVPIAVLHCPETEEVFQWRGELTTDSKVVSPSGCTFSPLKSNVPEDGGFICPHCGNPASVIDSIRTLPENARLSMHVYAMQAYYMEADPREDDEEDHSDLFVEGESPSEQSRLPRTTNLIWKNKGKYFTRFSHKDLAASQRIVELWNQHKVNIPWPKSEIPPGFNTNQMLKHNYLFWHQMFNERQLLAFSTLLKSIQLETNDACRELLLLAFSGTLERNNLFCRYFNDRNTIQGNFDQHHYAPKLDPAENCVWGPDEIRGSFQNMLGRVREGIAFRSHVYDRDVDRLGITTTLATPTSQTSFTSGSDSH